MLVCLIMTVFLSVWKKEKKGEKSELGWITSLEWLTKLLLFRLSNKDKGDQLFLIHNNDSTFTI